jgi:hypothetical protein
MSIGVFMEIWHRISFNSRLDAAFFSKIESIQINYTANDLPERPAGKSKYVYFDISESDVHWPQIFALMAKYKITSHSETYFNNQEILSSDWLRLIPTFGHLFPQPEKTWVRNPVNYSDFCHNCGTFKQVSPFRIKHEPKNQKYDFQSSPWAWVFFCSKRVIYSLKENGIRGYEDWDVIIHGSNTPSQAYSQLFFINLTQPGLLDLESLRPETCHVCNHTKFYAHLRGVMQYKRNAIDPNLDIVQNYEWFGGGGKSAYREILISNKFAKLIIESGWKGVRMKVVELV